MAKEHKKIEIRTTPVSEAHKLQIREITREDGTKEESRVITGTAIVFNEESQVLDDWGCKFVEIIKPEACTQEFVDSQDVKLNLLHNRDNTIGRSNKTVGNLKLTVDDEGLKFEIEVPKCDLGDQALELVRAGVYSGCSFEFMPQDYEISERKESDGTEMTVITHTKFESLSAITIAMDPAYKQTEVNAREMLKKTPEGIEREKRAEARRKRESEQAAARLRIRQRELRGIQQENFNF